MCSKFIKLIVLLSLLVCCGFAGRVLYSRFGQSFSRTRERSTSHFGVRSGIIFPWSFSPCITQTQRRNTLILGISMAEKSFDYKSWSLEELRAEARKRFILFTRKDGVKTLASKLRMHDRLMSEKESNTEEKLEFEETVDEEEASDLTFDQRLQLLQLERQIRIEEREAEREKREYERQVERERREYERQKAREEEERSIREEERLKTLRNEKEEFAIREAGRQQSCVRKQFIKIREMREGEDIDDYFRIFEMTAKAQGLPEDEWVGNLVPKLTEKAKSIYLEIPDPAAQNYEESKSIIIKGYQLTADHYRYRFRTSEKKPDEDFVQWGYRTRRYLNRWMTVAEATGDVEKILEQFMIERLLDAVSPELRAWLKEQKPKTAEELGNLANLHVQSRKGPLVEGRFASFGKNKGVSIQKQPQIKREPPIKDQASGEQQSPSLLLVGGILSYRSLAINVGSKVICLSIVLKVITSRRKGTYYV